MSSFFVCIYEKRFEHIVIVTGVRYTWNCNETKSLELHDRALVIFVGWLNIEEDRVVVGD